MFFCEAVRGFIFLTCFWCRSQQVETRKHSKTIGESFKNKVCEKKRNVDPRSNLEWIWESFYGPFGVFLGPGVVLDRFFSKSKFYAKKSHASKIRRIEFWGGRPFKLSQKRTPKPRSPRPKSKGQKPKEQRNDRKGNRSRSRPEARWRIYIYIYSF